MDPPRSNSSPEESNQGDAELEKALKVINPITEETAKERQRLLSLIVIQQSFRDIGTSAVDMKRALEKDPDMIFKLTEELKELEITRLMPTQDRLEPIEELNARRVQVEHGILGPIIVLRIPIKARGLFPGKTHLIILGHKFSALLKEHGVNTIKAYELECQGGWNSYFFPKFTFVKEAQRYWDRGIQSIGDLPMPPLSSSPVVSARDVSIMLPEWKKDQAANVQCLLDYLGIRGESGIILNMGSGWEPIVIQGRQVINIDSLTGINDADSVAKERGAHFLAADFYDTQGLLARLGRTRRIAAILWYDLAVYIRAYADSFTIWDEAENMITGHRAKLDSPVQRDEAVNEKVEEMAFLRHWSIVGPGGYFIIASDLYPSPHNQPQRFFRFEKLIERDREKTVEARIKGIYYPVAVIFHKGAPRSSSPVEFAWVGLIFVGRNTAGRNTAVGILMTQTNLFEGYLFERFFISEAFQRIQNFDPRKSAFRVKISRYSLGKMFGSNAAFFEPDIKGIDFWVVGDSHLTSSLIIVNIHSNYNNFVSLFYKYGFYLFSFIFFIIPYLIEREILFTLQASQFSLFPRASPDSFENFLLITASMMDLLFSVLAQSDWLFDIHKNILPTNSNKVNRFISDSSKTNPSSSPVEPPSSTSPEEKNKTLVDVYFENSTGIEVGSIKKIFDICGLGENARILEIGPGGVAYFSFFALTQLKGSKVVFIESSYFSRVFGVISGLECLKLVVGGFTEFVRPEVPDVDERITMLDIVSCERNIANILQRLGPFNVVTALEVLDQHTIHEQSSGFILKEAFTAMNSNGYFVTTYQLGDGLLSQIREQYGFQLQLISQTKHFDRFALNTSLSNTLFIYRAEHIDKGLNKDPASSPVGVEDFNNAMINKWLYRDRVLPWGTSPIPSLPIRR